MNPTPTPSVRKQDGKSSAPHIVRISSKHIACLLLGIIASLLAANLIIIYLRFVMGFEHLRGFIHGFYFDAEANFPSLYSALAILFCAVLLWMIGSLQTEKAGERAGYWKFLSVVFVFLSLDEFASLHEYLIQPLRRLTDQSFLDSGYLYFAWFIPYTLFVLLLGIVFFQFLMRLPAQTRLLFFLGGTVFLSGAVGMEMAGGKYWADQGWAIDGSDPVDLRYALIVTLEELLEMVGIAIFLYGLTTHYLKGGGEHSLRISITDADRFEDQHSR